MTEAAQRLESVGAGPQGAPLVEVRNLRKYYGADGGLFSPPPVKAVDGVTFTIHRGETLGLVGESGCGKTTLGRTLVQLEHATEGEIDFDGTDVTRLSGKQLKQWRRDAQIVFQDPESSLNDRMTIGEIIREPLDVHDWKTPGERREWVQDLLDSVGLQPEHYYRYPHQFSGGQRQRIGIARALALEPEFIVLDEPVSALDMSVQAKILNLLEDLQDEYDLTYLFIAHDLSAVRHICDRVAVMYLGKIMEIGPTEELYTDPANPYTRSLLSAIPEPDPTSTKQRITLPGTPPSPRDPPTGCQFTTRCPAKIRPSELTGLDAESEAAIDSVREVVRERSEAAVGPLGRVKRVVGLFSRFDDVDEAVADALEDVVLPPRVRTRVDEAVEMVRAGYPDEAREHLDEDFSSGEYLDTVPEMSDEVWEAVERFREIVRERDRIELGLRAQLDRRLGRFSKFDDIDESIDDLFGELDEPQAVTEHVETAAEYVREGYPGEARQYLSDQFDTVCDTDRPRLHDVGSNGRQSYCHRHTGRYEDVDAALGIGDGE